MSNDGRYVLFVSESTNFEPAITPFAPNGTYFVYLRDRLLHTTRFVSFAPDGHLTGAVFIENKAPSISNDGRYITWSSPNNGDGVFLRDLLTGVTTQLASANVRSDAVVNGAGTVVVYTDLNGTQIGVYDIASQTTQVLPLNVSNVYRVDVSDDGRFIAFPSSSIEQNGIIVYDRLLQTATNLGGNPPQFSGGETVISGDGRFVVFDTYDQILPEDQNQYEDVYLVDRTALPPSGPVTVTFNASADTYVRSGSDNRNMGAGGFMNIQSSGNNRSLVRFDESALQSAIGNSVIVSAKLRLTITDNGNNWGTTGRTVAVYRLLTNWAEGNGTENDRGTGRGCHVELRD